MNKKYIINKMKETWFIDACHNCGVGPSLRSIIWTMEFCVANQMAFHNHLLTYGLTNYIDCV